MRVGLGAGLFKTFLDNLVRDIFTGNLDPKWSAAVRKQILETYSGSCSLQRAHSGRVKTLIL